jgi:hypothetical protein
MSRIECRILFYEGCLRRRLKTTLVGAVSEIIDSVTAAENIHTRDTDDIDVVVAIDFTVLNCYTQDADELADDIHAALVSKLQPTCDDKIEVCIIGECAGFDDIVDTDASVFDDDDLYVF